MTIFLHLLLVFLLSVGCGETNSKRNTASPISQSTGNDVAVFEIEGGGHYSHLPEGFNRWSTLEKTKGRVHLFAVNESELIGSSGIKHVVSENRLANELSETLAAVNPERLIIFLTGHGAASGNFCYESATSCHLTADVLVDALVNYSKGKDLRLRQVLVIPYSCYNKLLMDQFAQLLKPKSFPFAITFISQKIIERCSTESPAETLLENLMKPDGPLTDGLLDEFMNLRTVEQLINFQNGFYAPSFKRLEYQVRYNQSPSPTELSEFGFDIRIMKSFDFDAVEERIAFPNGKSVKALLVELKLPERFQSRVQILRFEMAESKPDGTPNIREVHVGGNPFVVINEPDLQNKLVMLINVILSQT